jgi:gluconate 2-dehydrogenase gamma chain
MKRREFIELSGSTLGGLLVYSLAGAPRVLSAHEGTIKVPLRFFTRREAKVIVAACERIFPADDSGPGATQAGAVVYIDRQLAGPYGKDSRRYTQPPFAEAAGPGYQGRESPRETYRAGIPQLGADFAALDGAAQDERLAAIEKTHFFQLLRQHTIEGMFCDPMHGGNAGLIGWQWLGYPGPQMSYRAEMGKYNGVAYRPKPQSLEQILGYPVKPWEDEEQR